jgi:hypothetical protein
VRAFSEAAVAEAAAATDTCEREGGRNGRIEAGVRPSSAMRSLHSSPADRHPVFVVQSL